MVIFKELIYSETISVDACLDAIKVLFTKSAHITVIGARLLKIH